MSPKPTSNYSFAADLVRFVSILGVVSLHILNSVYERPDFQGGLVWWATNIWNALSRPCIPLFIMLSGYLLIPKYENRTKLFNRIIYRLLIPLLAFFILFQIWYSQGLLDLLKNLNPLTLMLLLLQAKVGILYYLLILIDLYLLLPLICQTFLPLPPHPQLLTAGFFTLLGMGLVSIEYATHTFFLNNFLLIGLPYLGFFLMGHLLGNVRLNRMKLLVTCLIYTAAVITTCLLSLHYLNQKALGGFSLDPSNALSSYFDFHLSPNVVVMSLALFTLIFQFDWPVILQFIFIKRVVQKVAQASYGIYLFHLFLVIILEKYFNFSVDYNRLPLALYLILKFALVFIGAYGLTQLFRRTHLLRLLIGEGQSQS